MDVTKNNERRCRMCPEVIGEPCEGMVYCMFLNEKVWGESIMCPHGDFLLDCF